MTCPPSTASPGLALDRPHLAVTLLFTGEPTDRALTGWRHPRIVPADLDTLIDDCRDVPTFT